MTARLLQYGNSAERSHVEPVVRAEATGSGCRENHGGLGMNWDRIEGNWKQFTGKVQQQWGKLTDDDLQLVEGRRNELVGRIQERYGYARDRAEREVDDWLRGI
jgi:uncharacterized protein YjbJ (UPF0337 family)